MATLTLDTIIAFGNYDTYMRQNPWPSNRSYHVFSVFLEMQQY